MEVNGKIEEIKEKMKGSNLDWVKIEQHLREVNNELLIKRNQVSQLTKDLDEANSKNFELIHQLEATKSALKETQFNVQLSSKNLKSAEDNLKIMKDNYFKMKIKEDMKSSELNTLNAKVQNLERERLQQFREVEELKDQLNYTKLFQEQLENRYRKLKMETESFDSDVASLKVEHLKVQEITTSLQFIKEFSELNKRLMQNNSKLKKEKSDLENAFIEVSAKYECLEQLMKSNVNLHEQNIIAKIKLLQHGISSQISLSNENFKHTLSNLTEKLNAEVTLNAKLIIQNEEYEAKIKELETRLKNTNPEPPKPQLPLKEEDNEIIEITDV